MTTRAEAALRKLLDDVTAARKCNGTCDHVLCDGPNAIYDYLSELARDGLADEPAAVGTKRKAVVG